MIVFRTDLPQTTLERRVARGALVRLAAGVYTTDTRTDRTLVVKREWLTIVGGLFPGAVITDRSAVPGGPVNGYLYLAHDAREREVKLPGLTVLARRGAPAQSGDVEMPGGLHLASRPRALAENARPTRARGDRPSRGYTDTELGDWVDRLCRIDGEQRLLHYREEAEQMAGVLGVPETAMARLSQLVGMAVGTKDADSGSAALRARRGGYPYDADRVARFGLLTDALRDAVPQNIPVDENLPRYGYLAFFESYFSNFIEGTRFELGEAVRLVYEGVAPEQRTNDAHDLVGTYRVVADEKEMRERATTPDDYINLLRRRHSLILAERDDLSPGLFKEKANRAGNTEFVAPDLVVGTLRAGFERLHELDTAWERAVYAMFLVAEVHPFNDGNGRLARVMMNSELVAAGQSRIIIPTVFREDYLAALRRLSRADDPSVLIKALRIGQEFTSRINYSTIDMARQQLDTAMAFDPADADHRLVMPSRLSVIEAEASPLPPAPA